MTEIADILRVHGHEYLAIHGHHILPSQYRAIGDIIACRSGPFGGHLMACDQCGHTHYSYHSCCNRSCPKCLTQHSEKWIKAREKEILPTTYFHVVFTIPRELRWMVLRHQKAFYNILFQAAAKTLKKLGKDPHYIGGDMGFYAVLHTWTQALIFHPHLHCLIPGCGIDHKGKWIQGRKNYLFPAKAVASIFRACFMKIARKPMPDIALPDTVWKPKWVVHIKPSIQGPEKVIKYLGRYIHRIAITNHRILSLNKGKVRFKYRDNQQNCWKIMTLSAVEFIHRFLQHVLPKGFHKVRTYGILHPTQRKRLKLTTKSISVETLPEKDPKLEKPKTLSCVKCASGVMRVIETIMPSIRIQRQLSRGPPW